jgi:hypothetical protein
LASSVSSAALFWGRRLALRDNCAAGQCVIACRPAVATAGNLPPKKVSNRSAFWLKASPAPFRNIPVKYMKLRDYIHILIGVDIVHNGTSLASIRMDHLAGATSTMTKPGQPLGRGIN